MKRPQRRTLIILVVFLVSVSLYGVSFIPPSLSDSPSKDFIRILAGPFGFRDSPTGAVLDINMSSGSVSLTIQTYNYYNASYRGPTIFYIMTPFQISDPIFNQCMKAVCTGANGLWNESVTTPVSVEPNLSACYPIPTPCGILGTTWYVVVNQTAVWSLQLQMQMTIPQDPLWGDQKLSLVFSNGFSGLPQEISSSFTQRFKKAPFINLNDILSQIFYVNIETLTTPDSVTPLPLVVRGGEYTWNVTYPISLLLPGSSKGQTIQVSTLGDGTKMAKPFFNSLGAIALGSVLGLVFDIAYSAKNAPKEPFPKGEESAGGKTKPSLSQMALVLIFLGVVTYLLVPAAPYPLIQFGVLVLIALVGYGLVTLVEPLLRSSWNTGTIARARSLLPFNRLLRLTVIIFGVLLMALAYVSTVGAVYAAYPVGAIGPYLMMIEGLLLVLLSVFVFSGRWTGSKQAGNLAILTVFSILFSLVTIMLGQMTAALGIVPVFFVVDVGIFVVVVGAYSWLLIEARQPS